MVLETTQKTESPSAEPYPSPPGGPQHMQQPSPAFTTGPSLCQGMVFCIGFLLFALYMQSTRSPSLLKPQPIPVLDIRTYSSSYCTARRDGHIVSLSGTFWGRFEWTEDPLTIGVTHATLVQLGKDDTGVLIESQVVETPTHVETVEMPRFVDPPSPKPVEPKHADSPSPKSVEPKHADPPSLSPVEPKHADSPSRKPVEPPPRKPVESPTHVCSRSLYDPEPGRFMRVRDDPRLPLEWRPYRTREFNITQGCQLILHMDGRMMLRPRMGFVDKDCLGVNLDRSDVEVLYFTSAPKPPQDTIQHTLIY
jgi:hypothetical protein